MDRKAAAGWALKRAVDDACKGLGEKILGRLVPVPSYYEWKRKYEASGRKRSALLDSRGWNGQRGRGFDRRFWGELEARYLTKNRNPLRKVYDQVAALLREKGITDIPSYSAASKRMRKVWPAARADYYRLGPQLWLAKHAPKLVRDVENLPGNHTVEIDHIRFDFWARVGSRRARLWLTILIDRASDLVVGWAITTNPSQDSLSLAFRRHVMNYGAALKYRMDRGEDMRSGPIGKIDPESVGGIVQQLGAELDLCNRRSPWEKGTVEAKADTIHDYFCRSFASYCGGSTQSRPEGSDQWSRENLDKLPTVPEVKKLFEEFLKADAERPSSAAGIKPLSPRQKFEQTRIARRTCPEHVLNVLLLKLTNPRKVTSKGILYLGLHYWHDGGRLFEFQGRELRLRVDPLDLSYAWACGLDGKPLFRLTQNFVKGTADDARRGRAMKQRARKAIKDARIQQVIALDDDVTATYRAQAEYYRGLTAKHEPAEPVPAPAIAPIRTVAAEAVAEAAADIRREELRDKARPRRAPEPLGFTADELRRLALPTDEELEAMDRAELEELDELCG